MKLDSKSVSGCFESSCNSAGTEITFKYGKDSFTCSKQGENVDISDAIIVCPNITKFCNTL